MSDIQQAPNPLDVFVCQDGDNYTVRVLDRQTGEDYHSDRQFDDHEILTRLSGKYHEIVYEREKYRLHSVTEDDGFYIETYDSFKEHHIPLDDMDQLNFRIDEDQLEHVREQRTRQERIEQAGLSMDEAVVVIDYGMSDPPCYVLVDFELIGDFVNAGRRVEDQVEALPDVLMDPQLYRREETEEDVRERLLNSDQPIALVVGALREAKYGEDERFIDRVESCSGVKDVHETLNEHDIDLVEEVSYIRT